LGTRIYIEPTYEEIAKPFFNYLSVYLDNKSGFDEIDLELLIKCFDYIKGKRRNEAKAKMMKYLHDHILSFLENIDIKNEDALWEKFLIFTFSDTNSRELDDVRDTWEQNFNSFLYQQSDNIKNTKEFESLNNWLQQ
jgi:hypothetical protein